MPMSTGSELDDRYWLILKHLRELAGPFEGALRARLDVKPPREKLRGIRRLVGVGGSAAERFIGKSHLP